VNNASIYASRVVKLPLLTADGDTIGRLEDLVIGPPVRGAPSLLGLVAQVGHRRIFVSAARIRQFDVSGATLSSAAIDLRPFQQRTGELLVSELLDRPFGREVVMDLALRQRPVPSCAYEIAEVVLVRKGPLGRTRTRRNVSWQEMSELFDVGPAAAELVKLRSLHPAETARALRDLSDPQREELVEAMEDEDLADVLEELPEPDQAAILGRMEMARAVRVLEEMEPDDAADLLSELPLDQRRTLLSAMDPEEADPLRRLLLYEGHTAGGLMTPEPIILPPEATVAEALARLRSEEITAAVAACVFVTQPPTQPPTGPYLGAPSFQRLLREPPSTRLGEIVEGTPEPIEPSLPEVAVAERLAAYNLLSIPVCDPSGRLLGAVTVDDVLDRTLPAGWRSH
jgi:CBS domain-containing protein